MPASAMMQKLWAVLLLVAMAAPVVGCGRKTTVIPPPDTTYPREYPTR